MDIDGVLADFRTAFRDTARDLPAARGAGRDAGRDRRALDPADIERVWNHIAPFARTGGWG